MSNNFLTIGDIIEIKVGMDVYANILEKYIYSNRGFSEEITCQKITIGNIYKNNTDVDSVLDKATKRIVSSLYTETGLKLPEVNEVEINDYIKNILSKYKIDSFDTSNFAGEYIVTNTAETGAGYVHTHDYYENGHKVTCKKLINGKVENDSEEISFYQSGSFTAVITPEEIQPIR